MDNKSSYWEKIVLIVMSILLIALFCLSGQLQRFNVSGEIFGMEFGSSAINGVITQCEVIAIVGMRLRFRKYSYVCVLLCAFSIITSMFSIIMSRSLAPIPAVMTAFGLMIILFVIGRFIKRIDEHETELKNLSETNYLTGLPNRRKLVRILNEKIHNKEKFYLVFMEIMNFNSVNEVLGHESGDALLISLSEKLKENSADDVFLAKLDGYEFAFVISDTRENIIRRINEFTDNVRKEVVLGSSSVFIELRYGVVSSEQADNSGNLMSYADIAIRSSNRCRDTINFFQNKMSEEIKKEAEISAAICKAIDDDTLFLMFQPQFTTKNKKLRGFETLVRMRDENGNIVSPGVFIPVAEKTDLIVNVDRWVLRNALRTFKPVIESGYSDLMLSVNVSVSHINEDDFVSYIRKTIDETGFPAKNLEIEVTESVMIRSVEEVIGKLRQLHDMGIAIALDDFGTGYASLSYLKSLPIDLLKIDKAFIDDIASSDNESDFVNAIISLGHIMHFSVISEGVEEENQLSELKKLGCDFIQGYIWGRPMEFSAAKGVIAEFA